MDVGGLFFSIMSLLTFASYTDRCGVRNDSSISHLSKGVLFMGIPDKSQVLDVSSTRMVRKVFGVRNVASSASVTSLCVSSRDVVPFIVRGKGVSVDVSGTHVMIAKAPLGSHLCSFIKGGASLSSETCRLRHRRDHVVVSKGTPSRVRHRVAERHRGLTTRVGTLTGRFVRGGCSGMLKPNIFVVLYDGFPCPIVAPLVRRVVRRTPSQFGGGSLMGSCIAMTHSGVRGLGTPRW